jgi:hypothetical protein
MGHVLKADRVRLEEPLRLNMNGTGTPEHAGSHRPAVQPRVRIAQSRPDFAILEVTCACGKVTHVRCEYGHPDAGAAATDAARP